MGTENEIVMRELTRGVARRIAHQEGTIETLLARIAHLEHAVELLMGVTSENSDELARMRDMAGSIGMIFKRASRLPGDPEADAGAYPVMPLNPSPIN